MQAKFSDDAKTALFGVAYFLQLLVFWISLQRHWSRISAFCAVPVDDGLRWFPYLHLMFFGLLVVGAIAIVWRRMRMAYLLLLAVGLAALPLQAQYVDQGKLRCDGP